MSYSRLLTYGDVIPLRFKCSPEKVRQECFNKYEWKQYNPRKKIPRYGLSITSLKGELDGIDLDSIVEYNKENNVRYTEMSFNTFTDVYHNSPELQKVVDPWKGHLGRSHILHLPPGGYFPPHKDLPIYTPQQGSLRILIPLIDCNVPDLYFIHDGKTLTFQDGRAYFVNTNKTHSLFSFNDTYMIVLNVASNDITHKIIGDNFLHS
tara:strand:+ start:19 stop:639 length:621 start_codon:yes stop_codon:yes gene_type:complete